MPTTLVIDIGLGPNRIVEILCILSIDGYQRNMPKVDTIDERRGTGPTSQIERFGSD